jgi:hypothetical protein
MELLTNTSKPNAEEASTLLAMPMELSSATMAMGTFNIRTTRPKVVKTGAGTDVAARYFVYKLYEATGGYSP